MGGAAGEAFANTLAASGMPSEHVLGREAIQNSADALRDGETKVRVVFRSTGLTGPEKAAFVAAAGLRELAERLPQLKLVSPNCFESLDSPDTPLPTLCVDDYGTTGLEGDPRDDESKFFRLLLTLGDGSKESHHGSGGSFGYGKSVYLSNSRVSTIFAYSRTRDGNGEPHTILIGCSFFKMHKVGDVKYSGRAWFGVEHQGGPDAYQYVSPLFNDEANALAADLGFTLRGEGDFGTSILIVDADLDEQAIVRGVEDWWWPRLISGGLDVDVIDETGRTDVPRPKKRDDLRPFIDAYEIAIGETPPKSGQSYRKIFNRKNDLGMGVCAIVVLQKLADDSYAVPEARRDAVALIREPRMVVSYHRPWSPGQPAVAGVYVADEDIDDMLKLAEPPAHDGWDWKSTRLRDADGTKHDIVETVLRRVAIELKGFQKAASPPPAPRARRLSFLERTLASLLKPSKRGRGERPTPTSAPIHLQYEVEPRAILAGTSQLKMQSRFSVRLKADADVDELTAKLRVSCHTVADGDLEGDVVAVQISSPDANLLPDDDGWLVQLKPGTTIHVVADSEPYDPAWTVRFVPEVEAA